MLLVVGFIVSGYTGLVGRNRKPFNPLLGETFDFIHEDGWQYHAEQVLIAISDFLRSFIFRSVIIL